MKNNKNFAFGFTIAELLIAMLISTLVAAAMVPIIGLKKVKFPTNVFRHGIAECYYEPVGEPDEETGDYEDWRLMFYYADNGRRRHAVATPVAEGQSYCTFNVPKGDFFEIIAIGAGTDGHVMVPVFGDATSGSDLYSGYISVDSNYQKSIDSAVVGPTHEPIGDKLKTLLNDWANSYRKTELYARYLFDSPVGAGGTGRCAIAAADYGGPGGAQIETIRLGNDNASTIINTTVRASNCGKAAPSDGGYWYSADLDTAHDALAQDHSKCWFVIHAPAEPSGYGIYTTNPLTVPLSGNTRITTYNGRNDKSGIEVREGMTSNSVILNSSKSGRSPTYHVGSTTFNILSPRSESDTIARCTGAWCDLVGWLKSTDMINPGAQHGNEGANSCNQLPGSSADEGRVYFDSDRESESASDPNKLRWNYNAIVANPRMGTGGEIGQETRVVYENLKGTLYLLPAQYLAEPDANNTSSVRLDANDPNTSIVTARSGQHNGGEQVVPFAMINTDMPIPSAPLAAAKPLNKDAYEYLAKISTAKFDGGLRFCNNDWCPGFAGNGVYFYIDNIPDVSSLSVTNLYNDAVYSIPIQSFQQEHGIDLGRNKCDDGVTDPIEGAPVTYIGPDLTEQTFTPKYCRERKNKGRPGAVIIVW